MKQIFISIIFSFLFFSIYSQKINKITIKRANIMTSNKALGKDIQRLIGNVIFEHESTLLYCDSAYFNSRKNSLTAYSNIHINNNDSLHIYGDTLFYNGNNKTAIIVNNVRMVDNDMTLNTNYLNYNLDSKVGNYTNGGTISDRENNLESVYGTYFGNTNFLHFKKDVILNNPNYIMESDTLHYNYKTKISYFYGPTTITSEDNLIYCENGWYNTESEISQYNENAYLINESQKLSGDSIYYDRNNSFGKAFNNVEIIDTVENILLRGNVCKYFENEGNSFMTDSAHAIFIDNEDSLFIHSDTLVLQFDSLQNAEFIYSYYSVRFFKNDLQGKCDSLVYNVEDSLLEMFTSPVLWSDVHQLSGDYIKLTMDTTNNPDSIYVIKNVFILSHDTLENYNQVKGTNLYGRFKNNKLKKVNVISNCQTVYFTRDENEELVGINNSKSNHILVTLDSNKVKEIKLIEDPDAILFPIEQATEKNKVLPGFNNQEAIRPKDKLDIFRKI